MRKNKRAHLHPVCLPEFIRVVLLCVPARGATRLPGESEREWVNRDRVRVWRGRFDMSERVLNLGLVAYAAIFDSWGEVNAAGYSEDAFSIVGTHIASARRWIIVSG